MPTALYQEFFLNLRNALKDELKSIISGAGQVTKGTAIQTIANYIRKSKATGADTKDKELVKKQETAAILSYVSQPSLTAQTCAWSGLGINKHKLTVVGEVAFIS
ncbi:MAG: hypothetical protein WDO19_16700 [Bacteroidota bacterium]